jgi:lysozyme
MTHTPPWGDSTNWWIHQYQGDALRLPGFSGKVDMNRFNTMVKGATGDRVKWVQRRLDIAQNGRFDDAIDRALRAFQKKKGLVSNGVVDLKTFVSLCWSNP